MSNENRINNEKNMVSNESVQPLQKNIDSGQAVERSESVGSRKLLIYSL